ncbi:hypothetical protein [Dokdonella soli]
MAHAVAFDGGLAAASSASSSRVEAAADEPVLGRWHDYALSSITPQFSWAVLPPSYGAPQLLDNYSGDVARAPLFKARETSATRLGISVATGTVADTPAVLPNPSPHLIGVPQPGLQRTVIAPTLASDWGDRGTLRLTGVLAYQRFASLGLGMTATDGWAPPPPWLSDSSYGAGARVDVGSAIGSRLRWDVGYQSRVGMGAFANYRGVFADAGNFDIPASATAGLSYALTPQFAVDIGVQRVMYSAIKPFTSSSLPTRFLALLGDGSSPVFAWRDLNVYSIGWTLRDEDVGDVQLRYTTRQQPIPTSTLLANALAPATANDMISLGWSRGFGASSNLSFTASYASSPYYLLMPSYLSRSDGTASQFEFEAIWAMRF